MQHTRRSTIDQNRDACRPAPDPRNPQRQTADPRALREGPDAPPREVQRQVAQGERPQKRPHQLRREDLHLPLPRRPGRQEGHEVQRVEVLELRTVAGGLGVVGNVEKIEAWDADGQMRADFARRE